MRRLPSADLLTHPALAGGEAPHPCPKGTYNPCRPRPRELGPRRLTHCMGQAERVQGLHVLVGMGVGCLAAAHWVGGWVGGWWSVWAPGLRSINHVWGTREGRGAPWVLFPRLAWNAQNHFQASCLPSLPPAGRCSGRCYSLHVPVATGPATTNHPMRPPGQGVAEGSHGSVQASASHPGVPFGTEPADLSMFLPNPPFLPCPNISLKRGPYPSQGSCSQPPTLPTLTPGLQGGALGRKTNTFSCRREQQSGLP